MPPYAADFLTNYEVGYKTTWLDGALRFNGALFQQEWKHFQFAFLGQNSFTEIHNGPNARIRGIEADINLTPLQGLSLNAAATYLDAKTRQNLCAIDDPTFTCADIGDGNMIAAPKGTRLPITPRIKANATARYTFPIGAATNAHLQGVVVHQSSAASDIRIAAVQTGTGAIYSPADQLGRLPAYTTADFAAGIEFGNFSIEGFVDNAFDERAEITRFAECGSCLRTYIVPVRPRTFGIRAGAKF